MDDKEFSPAVISNRRTAIAVHRRLCDARKLKSGETPEFVALYCANVEKHMEYQQKNADLLRPRASKQSVVWFPAPI